MIDENTYFIGMTVISYLISLFLAFGMIYIQVAKVIAKDDKVDDATRSGTEIMLNEFYDSDYITKIVIILKFGALFVSTIFTEITMSVVHRLKKLFNKGE